MDFTNTKISTQRAVTSYAKVQSVISSVVRGKRWLQHRSRKEYLNVGCGPYPLPNFTNLDWGWRPDIELCWDITEPLPLKDASFLGIYSEHCLQHLPWDGCRRALAEFYRILKPGGVVRLVLTDAELYLDLYQRHRAGEIVEFPYSSANPHLTTPLMHVDRAFRNNGEIRTAYDFETIAAFMRGAGFSEVARAAFRQGRDPVLLIDHAHRAVESLYAEAVK